MPVYNIDKSPVNYSDQLVRVTGKLEVKPIMDEFGYKTQFRIYANEIEILQETEKEQVLKSYYKFLINNGILSNLALSLNNINHEISSITSFTDDISLSDKQSYLKNVINHEFFEQGTKIVNSYFSLLCELKIEDGALKNKHDYLIGIFKENILILDSLNNLTKSKDLSFPNDASKTQQVIERYKEILNFNDVCIENFHTWNNSFWDN